MVCIVYGVTHRHTYRDTDMAKLNMSNKQASIVAELIKDYGYASAAYGIASSVWQPLHRTAKDSEAEVEAWAEVKASKVRLRRAEVALELVGIDMVNSAYSDLTPSAHNEYHTLRHESQDSVRSYDHV